MDECMARRRYEAKENRILLNRRVSLHSIRDTAHSFMCAIISIVITSWHDHSVHTHYYDLWWFRPTLQSGAFGTNGETIECVSILNVISCGLLIYAFLLGMHF